MLEQGHLDIATRHLQQRFVFLKRCALAVDVCLWGAIVGLIATAVITLGGWSVPLFLVYGAVLAGSAVTFLVVAWRVQVSALAVLQRADRVQHFQERLSTAYEYLHQQITNPFVPGLATEAERTARQVDPRMVFPTHWPRRIWGIPLFLAALVGFTLLDLEPLRFEDLAYEETSQEVTREGKRLERWGRRLEELAKQQRLDRSLVLARHMQNLGRRLQREGGKKPEAAQRISTLSQYLQRMQQELHERALMTNIGGMMAQDVMVSGKSLKQELQDILKLLQHDGLPREMTLVAEQGIRRLSQYLGSNPTLERLVQSLQAGNLAAARQLLQDILQQQQATAELEHMERARRALEYSSRSIQRDGESSDSPVQGRPLPGDSVAGDSPLEFDDEEMSEDMPSMEDFATPGFDGGVGTARHSRTDLASLLRESELALSRVQTKRGEGAMRLAYIRHLPMQNEAHMPVEQVVVQYQHTAEEVLSQEHIPRDYREQIKQYFLAIGMIPENRP